MSDDPLLMRARASRCTDRRLTQPATLAGVETAYARWWQDGAHHPANESAVRTIARLRSIAGPFLLLRSSRSARCSDGASS
jgi:hypothetical protein